MARECVDCGSPFSCRGGTSYKFKAEVLFFTEDMESARPAARLDE